MDFTRAATLAALVRTQRDEFGMTDEHFWKMHHRANLRARNEGIDAHLRYLDDGHELRWDHQQLCRRLNECLERLRAGDDWVDAIRNALAKFPKGT
jgi:hypothetical protein